MIVKLIYTGWVKINGELNSNRFITRNPEDVKTIYGSRLLPKEYDHVNKNIAITLGVRYTGNNVRYYVKNDAFPALVFVFVDFLSN